MYKTGYYLLFKFFFGISFYIQLVFSFYAFMPVDLAYSQSQIRDSYQQSDDQRMNATGYIAGYGESAESIAKKYNMDVETLRRLNQKTVFLKNFDHLQKGDVLLVPLAFSPDEPERDSRLSGYAYQAGTFLANGGRASDAQSMATQFLVGKAGSGIEQWLNQYGTARFQLNIDNHFSLKNSQFDMLLPVWDYGNRLFFTQGSIHRTDDRTQSNLGLGVRYFVNDYMIGSNVFWDYDISRSHSRTGVGVEYWRDYLKLSANGYFRLSSWNESPDVEDYDERPANGWDVRAAGYLPFHPQLGLKLNYEQYYGDEVALFGKGNRQHNPYAVTFGINYTPVPLMTFNVDHRRGASGNNDTRFGAQLTYKFGMPFKRQLDPDAVNTMRTVAGSRYDFVDRNNNIVLEYRRQEVIRLSMASYIAGLPGENHSLGEYVEAKHGLARIDLAAPALLAAGGNVITGSGLTDHTAVLPPYRVGGEENNTYLVTATAADKKGNVSKQATTRIVVNAPAIDSLTSTFLPVESTIAADDTSSVTLTLKIQTSQNLPADINVSDIDLSVSGKKSARISDFTRITAGVYELTVTAGTEEETITLTPSVDGLVLPSAQVIIRSVTPNGDQSTLTASSGVIPADNSATSTLTFVARDIYGNAVGGIADQLSLDVTDSRGAAPASGAVSVSSITESSTKGTYTASLKGTLADIYTIRPRHGGTQVGSLETQIELTADGTEPGGDGHSTFTASPGVIPADNSAASTLIFVARDIYGNAVGGIADRLSLDVTDSRGAAPASGAVSVSSITESSTKGTYTATLKGTLADIYTIRPRHGGTQVGSLETQIELTADGTEPGGDGHSTFTASPGVIPADNSAASTLTFVARDIYGNAVGGIADRLSLDVTDSRGAAPASGAVSVSSITESSTKGTYTATLKGTLADIYTIRPRHGGTQVGSLETQIELTADGTEPGGDGHSTFTASPGVIPADNSAASTLTFVARDIYGNAVGGIADQLSLDVTDSRGAAPASGAVSVSSITESSTKGTYTATLKGTLADIYTVKPRHGGTQVGSLETQIELTADITTAVITELKLQGDEVVKTANGTDGFDYLATVKDKSGNRVPNITVTWFKNTENAYFSAQASTTDANGQATVSLKSINSGGAANIQVSAKANADTSQVNADRTVGFVGYRFVLESSKKIIAVNGTSQYNVIAIPSDNSDRVVLTSEATWSISNTSVAVSLGGGLMQGKSAGTVNITATGTYKSLSYKEVETLTVRVPELSPVYGNPTGPLEEHIIRPPSYLLATRCGFIVDAIGTLEGITGGPGGDAKKINDMNKVISIKVFWGKYRYASSDTTIGKIEFYYDDGRTPQSCGRNEELTDIKSDIYQIPAGKVLQGVSLNADNYVWALQWITMDTDVERLNVQ